MGLWIVGHVGVPAPSDADVVDHPNHPVEYSHQALGRQTFATATLSCVTLTSLYFGRILWQWQVCTTSEEFLPAGLGHKYFAFIPRLSLSPSFQVYSQSSSHWTKLVDKYTENSHKNVEFPPKIPKYHYLHSPTVLDLFRKMEGQNFLHSIRVYTHVHRFPSRLTPVKGPPVTQWQLQWLRALVTDESCWVFVVCKTFRASSSERR